MTTVERWATIAAYAVVLTISGFLAWHLGYAPDEGSHLRIVHHYAHSVIPPDWESWQYGASRGHAYYLFSPVAYATYIPFEWINEAVGPVGHAARGDRFITRLGGLPIAAAQLAVTIAIVRRMYRGRSQLTVVAVALAANLIPQLRYIHSYVNADGLTILAATACFALALRLLQRDGYELADAALVGLTLALVAHVRFNAFPAGVALLGLFCVQVIRERRSWRERLRLAGVAVALPVLLAGSFHLYVYNEVGNRHVLPSIDNEELNDSTYTGRIEPRPPTAELVKLRLRGARTIWSGTWARMRTYVSVRGPVLYLLTALWLVGLFGVLVFARHTFTGAGRLVGLIALAAVLVIWIVMASSWLVGQYGKFLLPAACTALVAVILGGGAFVQRLWRRPGVLPVAALWLAVLVPLNVWVMGRVAGAY